MSSSTVAFVTTRLEFFDVMQNQQFEDLRRQARHLENELVMKLNSYTKLFRKSVSGPTADSMTIEIEQLLNKLTALNDHMADFSQQSGHLESAPSSPSSLFHVVQRHRDILQDYSREFSKTRSSLQSAKDRADLLGFTTTRAGANLSNRRNELYNNELGHILNSDQLVDQQIGLAKSTKDHLANQRGRLQDVAQRLRFIKNKYPTLNSLMQWIDYRKRRDAIIIAVVAAVCILLLLMDAAR